MDIKKNEQNGITIFAVNGRLDSNTYGYLKQQLMESINAGNHKIIVDFSHLDYISSAGLRILLIAAKHLKKSGDAFTICNLNRYVYEVFDISGFLAIIKVSKNLKKAIQYCQ